jgi:hypothetical protein
MQPIKKKHKSNKLVGLEALRLANHSFRIMWGPEKGWTDIEKEVEVEVDVPTRVR